MPRPKKNALPIEHWEPIDPPARFHPVIHDPSTGTTTAQRVGSDEVVSMPTAEFKRLYRPAAKATRGRKASASVRAGSVTRAARVPRVATPRARKASTNGKGAAGLGVQPVGRKKQAATNGRGPGRKKQGVPPGRKRAPLTPPAAAGELVGAGT